MLSKPGMLPNATLNRWVDYVRTFQFKLKHTPRKTFGPDGLSRRGQAPDDPVRVFDDDSEGEDEEIRMVKHSPSDPDPLDLDEFIDAIDTRSGFVTLTDFGGQNFEHDL